MGGAGAEGRDKVGLRGEDGDGRQRGPEGPGRGGHREEIEVTGPWWSEQQMRHGDDSGDRDKMGPRHGAGDMERTWTWWQCHRDVGGSQEEMIKVTADCGDDTEMANVTWR